jgi:gas vesicle protein
MKVLRIAAGLVLGVLVGAGLTMLFAPQAGAKTRELIQERIDAILEEGRQAAQSRRLELTAQYEALKQPQA